MVAFVALQVVVLAAMVVAVWFGARARFVGAFDATLVGHADALAALVEEEGDGIEFEREDAPLPRFLDATSPDLFAVLDADGRVLARSPRLEALPAFVGAHSVGSTIADFAHAASSYRGIVVAMDRPSIERPGRHVRASVFFASPLAPLRERLDGLLATLVSMAVGSLLVSALLAAWLAWRGLAPLRTLAADASRIGVDDLGARLDDRGAHDELRTLTTAFNDLLARIERAFERERRFAADAAHELRTPVAILKSGVQAALRTPRDAGRDRDAFESLLVDIDRLNALCESLLVASDVGQGGIDARLTAERWAGEVADAARRAAPRDEAVERLDVALARCADWPDLRADPVTTRCIVSNLVQNAFRHGDDRTRVRVSVERDGRGVHLRVEDDGPGVPEPFRERLFERFARADAARARSTGGAGLGLAICRATAQRLGGTIAYRPSEPTGSVFEWTVAPAD